VRIIARIEDEYKMVPLCTRCRSSRRLQSHPSPGPIA
jgi:hypothetical protein